MSLPNGMYRGTVVSVDSAGHYMVTIPRLSTGQHGPMQSVAGVYSPGDGVLVGFLENGRTGEIVILGRLEGSPFRSSATATNSLVADPAHTNLSALEIRDSGAAGRTAGAQLFILFDTFGNPIFSVGPAGGPTVFGDRIGARYGVFGNEIAFDAGVNPPGILLPNAGSAPFNHWWFQTGTPTATFTATGQAVVLHDVYWQIDGAAGNRLWICTLGGNPATATWLAIL